jgi:hypothetical protein
VQEASAVLLARLAMHRAISEVPLEVVRWVDRMLIRLVRAPNPQLAAGALTGAVGTEQQVWRLPQGRRDQLPAVAALQPVPAVPVQPAPLAARQHVRSPGTVRGCPC